jgi:integrase
MRNEKKRKLPRGVRKLPDGRFSLYVTRGGKPVRVIVTWELVGELRVPVPPTRLEHPSLELAKAALIKLQSKILEEQRTGVIEANAKTRIGSLLVLVEQDFLREGKKTWEWVLRRWNLHLKSHFAGVHAGELNSNDITRYIFLRQREKASAGSINRELSIVERMMHLGERTTPPLVRGVPHFPKLKESPPRTGFLEQDSYNKLRQHAGELWLRALLATLYVFAFRKGELLRLRVRQVNLIDGTINLPAGGTKNGMPRTIVMTTEVMVLITALIEGKRPNDHVFTRPDGSPVRDFRGAWTKMFAAAGVDERKCHDMRRSAIRNAIRRGVDRDTVKKISGHLTDDVFSRYNIQAVDDLRDAARRIEDGAVSVPALQTDTKTDISRETPQTSDQMLQ